MTDARPTLPWLALSGSSTENSFGAWFTPRYALKKSGVILKPSPMTLIKPMGSFCSILFGSIKSTRRRALDGGFRMAKSNSVKCTDRSSNFTSSVLSKDAFSYISNNRQSPLKHHALVPLSSTYLISCDSPSQYSLRYS